MRRPAVHLLAGTTVAVLGLNWPIMANGVDLVLPLWRAAFRMAGAAIVIGAHARWTPAAVAVVAYQVLLASAFGVGDSPW